MGIDSLMDSIGKHSDRAYERNWLFYLLLGLVLFAVWYFLFR